MPRFVALWRRLQLCLRRRSILDALHLTNAFMYPLTNAFRFLLLIRDTHALPTRAQPALYILRHKHV